ncbi:unnamed protein product [Pieris macdunnoughi]|uniref:Uncharacterized protein n=1 Tax=Pieris macdunnoughi TaxID=345717 RepID=A0A821W2U1_9NEOP|nr:unnamed protein product [Pieris macdunnoughi]CAF4917087.1 unnamed protein product [Pieris macdunnoughi]
MRGPVVRCLAAAPHLGDNKGRHLTGTFFLTDDNMEGIIQWLAKVKEWRDNYQAIKEKMTGQKQKGKIDKRKQTNAQGKRKSGETPEVSDVKRKREGDMEVEEIGTKRRHDDDDEGSSLLFSLQPRRTQLSSFMPSVLQKASTSNSNGSANGDKRPLSNHDFRNLLLKK